MSYLETLKWEVLPHPPYSPDIAPSDYEKDVASDGQYFEHWLFNHVFHNKAYIFEEEKKRHF